MPHLREGCGQLLHAFRYPDQGPHGIAKRRGLDQALERRDEPRIVLAQRATPATGPANPPLRQRLRIEINLATIDRRTGEPGDLRDGRETASTRVRTSAAANKRRPHSSSREPTVSHRRRIAASSIMPPTYAGSPKTGIPKTRVVNPTHDRRTAI